MEQKEVKNLIRINKKLIKKSRRIVPIAEPVVILCRRSGKAQILEGITQDQLEYEHTDGTKRYICLNDNYYRLNYGDDTAKVYLCHEDHSMPLPNKPTVDSKTLTSIVDNVLENANKWKAKAYEAKGSMFWKVALGIVAIIVAVAFYKMVVPRDPTPVIQVVKNATVFS